MDLQVRLQQLREKAQALDPAASSRPSLGDRLERLRVATPARRAPTAEVLAASLAGEVVAPGLIELARTYPLPFRHGDVTIASGRLLAEAAKSLGRLEAPVPPESLLYLDTETTGLA
ncbi:MAG: hypothetical protein ABWZ41_06640, partial [Burkholderiales bacterium]